MPDAPLYSQGFSCVAALYSVGKRACIACGKVVEMSQRQKYCDACGATPGKRNKLSQQFGEKRKDRHRHA